MATMLMTRAELEAREEATLAPYAEKAGRSRGRIVPEAEHPYRTAFQRDRDRCVHTSAFRALEYKTQVFVNLTGDYYRTRLTHSIEVSLIARTIARTLNANEDLTEVLAIAHDIGHPPFGHQGEYKLDEMMQEYGAGRFDHNDHNLRILEKLEDRYANFRGLNLTYEVREGLNKHRRPRLLIDGKEVEAYQISVEGQIADLADDITYNAHDLDDGLHSGLLTWDSLQKVELARTIAERIGVLLPRRGSGDEMLRYQVVRQVIDVQVEALMACSSERLDRHNPQSPDAVRMCREKLIAFDDGMRRQHLELKEFLMEHMYTSPQVLHMAANARTVITDLFNAYMQDTSLLPPPQQQRIAEGDEDGNGGTARIVCDYIAGMTDRFALKEHQRITGKVINYNEIAASKLSGF
jgi:dGTPase